MPAQLRIEQMLKDWKEAERSARDAELSLYRAYADFSTNAGPDPSEQLKGEATALRAQARRAYQTAMAAVDHVLEQADKRTRGF